LADSWRVLLYPMLVSLAVVRSWIPLEWDETGW